MLHQSAPSCTKLHKAAPKWTTLHQSAPSCTKLHKAAPKWTTLHQSAPSCTKLHQVAPNCTKLHQSEPSRTNLHQVAPKCTKLHQSAPNCTKLPKLHQVAPDCTKVHQTTPSCNTRLLPHAKMLLVPIMFFFWRVDYAQEENVLTDQMWFLPLISNWEVMTRILIFRGHCFWSAWFALWCKRIFSLTCFEMLSSSLQLNKDFRLLNFSKVPPGSE